MHATRPHRLAVLHAHEVETLSLAGFMRRIHEAEHRLCPGAVRCFHGEPRQSDDRRIVLAGGGSEVTIG